MMSDGLDVTEGLVLDHIMAILYVGRWSASEGLTEEEAQACIDHFNPYIKWRDVAVECGSGGNMSLWGLKPQAHLRMRMA